MNFIRSFLCCTMLFAMFSCEKADFLTKDIPEDFPETPPEKQKTDLVHHIFAEGYSEEWFYDDHQRVIEQKNTNGYSQRFFFEDGTVRQESLYDGVIQYVTTHTLNSNGYVIKSRRSNEGGDVQYVYDPDWHVIQEISRDALGNIRYAYYKFVVTGNTVKDSTINADGSWYVRTYTYPDSIRNTIASVNFGQPFFGVENRHGWQTCAVKYSNNTSTWYNNLFQQDAVRRIVRRDRITPNYQTTSSYDYY